MAERSRLTKLKIGSREHAEFSRLLVNTIQEYAIFLLDPQGHIATWNPGAQKLKGYMPDEIIGRHFSVFYPTRDVQAGKPAWELVEARKHGHVEDEGWRVRKDGTKFWANVVITALFGDDGELVGFAKVTRDLSERKKQEEQLYQANLKLRRQSAELQALNKSKDEFISLASHQLRTPASGVKQFLGLVLQGYAGELTDIQQDYLTRAYESNDREIDLINDLLRVAQLDAGKVVLRFSKRNINTLIEDVVNEQSDKFTQRRQLIMLDIPKTRTIAHVDESRFRMALENIIDNASKYTPDDGTISISVRQANESVVVAIADTGVGIDEVSQAKLFKKFSRIQNQLSDKVGGSGLGLYWAHKIVQLHKGTVAVESMLESGTTFTITIPKGDAHA